MRNIPVNLSGYRLTVAEEPTMKMRKDDNGREEAVTDRDSGEVKFVVSLFVKMKGEKGEEVRVTLDTDPGSEFQDGDRVELINPRMSPYSFKNARGETVSGVSFNATGLKPVA